MNVEIDHLSGLCRELAMDPDYQDKAEAARMGPLIWWWLEAVRAENRLPSVSVVENCPSYAFDISLDAADQVFRLRRTHLYAGSYRVEYDIGPTYPAPIRASLPVSSSSLASGLSPTKGSVFMGFGHTAGRALFGAILSAEIGWRRGLMAQRVRTAA